MADLPLMIVLIILLMFVLSLQPLLYTYRFLMKVYRRFSAENIKGKVVLITGASSGIGEQLAYEYAKRGACLVIVARRENLLQQVAERARKLGSPDVIPVCADVSKAEDCKRFVEEAINHFGRLDHLVNNAGIGSLFLIEDGTDVTKFEPVMDVNFWGSVHPTYFAMPYLKRTKGSIFVNASASPIMNAPGFGFYSASKAALISFYETMRAELAPEISITIAILGVIESEMSKGKHLNREGNTEVNTDFAKKFMKQLPVMSSSACAKSIVDAVCRKERHVIEPKWWRLLFLLKTLCPELFEFFNYMHYLQIKAWFAKNSSVSQSENKSD